jgi:hypothetical protein
MREEKKIWPLDDSLFGDIFSVMNSVLSLIEENVIVALLDFKTLYGY